MSRALAVSLAGANSVCRIYKNEDGSISILHWNGRGWARWAWDERRWILMRGLEHP